LFSPPLTKEANFLYGPAGVVYFAETVKILEGPAIMVTVSARLGKTREKKLYIDHKNVYPVADPPKARN